MATIRSVLDVRPHPTVVRLGDAASDWIESGTHLTAEVIAHVGALDAARDDVKVEMDRVLKVVEDAYPTRLRGLLPPIYGGSNLDPVALRGLISLFSKDIFKADHGGEDVIGRVYEYFIGEFASSEGKRGGEFFTPSSIVRTLVAMLEPERGTVFDPCCGKGGMFVQSDAFTDHSGKLSFYGQEAKDFTWRLCKMNLFIHGIDGNVLLGDTYFNDQHAALKADYIIANPPFNDGSKGHDGWGASRTRTRGSRSERRSSRSRRATRTRCGCCTSSTTSPRAAPPGS